MPNTKISAMTAAAAALAAMELPVNDAATSKKLTIDLLRQFFFTSDKYAPGAFTIPTEQFSIMTKQLVLTTTQRGTLNGTARLRII